LPRECFLRPHEGIEQRAYGAAERERIGRREIHRHGHRRARNCSHGPAEKQERPGDFSINCLGGVLGLVLLIVVVVWLVGGGGHI
jgi:hypothetical protein